VSASNNARAVSVELRVFGLKKLKKNSKTTDNTCPSPRLKGKSCRRRGQGAGRHGTRLVPPAWGWWGARHRYQNRFSMRQCWPAWRGTERTQRKSLRETAPGLRTPPEGRDAARASLPAASLCPVGTGKSGGILPPGGTGGCFHVRLPRGEVQCPSYIKCKPCVGSLTEQTPSSGNTHGEAEEEEERSLTSSSVGIAASGRFTSQPAAPPAFLR